MGTLSLPLAACVRASEPFWGRNFPSYLIQISPATTWRYFFLSISCSLGVESPAGSTLQGVVQSEKILQELPFIQTEPLQLPFIGPMVLWHRTDTADSWTRIYWGDEISAMRTHCIRKGRMGTADVSAAHRLPISGMLKRKGLMKGSDTLLQLWWDGASTVPVQPTFFRYLL